MFGWKIPCNGCLVSQAHVCSLEAKVRDHEDYNGELQEVEKWLLQMSGRLVAPDLMETSSLETITQQLAHHKVRLVSKEPKDALWLQQAHRCVCTHAHLWTLITVLKESGLKRFPLCLSGNEPDLYP